MMKNASFQRNIKKTSPSVLLSLSVRFMLLLAFAMLSLSALFVSLLRFAVTQKQNRELESGISLISSAILNDRTDELDFLNLPYYITYTVYETETQNVLATNDSLLPLLDSDGKKLVYFEKNYFTDGDLHIRCLTRKIEKSGLFLTVECAVDIANDSASKMISALPSLLAIAFFPVLILSFALSFLISRSTIKAFNKLREDYDRERAFTSNVSHELKTPLSIIDGHANLLKRWGKNDPAQLDDSIEAILRETGNMNRIVTTLLEIARIENGKIKIEKNRFFLKDFFIGLRDEFKITYPELSFEIADENYLEIETDVQKLHQVFTVILANSIKFAGKNCTITLAARKSGDKIELSASDNGTGFSDAVLPHVFERFYKGDESHNRNEGGAGLGLSIARTLVLALGGSIEARNSPYGGAVLKILLPST